MGRRFGVFVALVLAGVAAISWILVLPLIAPKRAAPSSGGPSVVPAREATTAADVPRLPSPRPEAPPAPDPRAGGIVRGTVVAQGSDEPIEGASVRVVGPTTVSSFATTDSSGRFEIRGVALGEGVLAVTKPGWCQSDRQTLHTMENAFGAHRRRSPLDADPGEGPRIFVAGESDAIERAIALVRAATITGRVVDVDGKPVAGALVSPRVADASASLPGDPLGGGYGETATTDADGRFEVASPVTRDEVAFDVKAPWLRVEPGEVVYVRDVSPRDVEISMAPVGRIELRVLDASGKPVEGAQLYLWPEAPPGVEILPDFEFVTTPFGTSNARGVLVVEAAPLGDFTTVVWHERHVIAHAARLRVEAGKTATAEVRLEAGRSIAGRVVRDDGEPLGELRVRVAPEDEEHFEPPLPTMEGIEVGAQGRFRIDCLRAQRYLLTMDLNGPGVVEPVVAEAGDLGVVIHIRPEGETNPNALSISGTVRLADGVAVATAWVTAERADGRHRYGCAVTGDDGSFRIERLESGAYDLRVSGHTPDVQLEAGQQRPNICVKRIADVAAGTKDMLVEVERGLSLTGRVRLPGGAPARSGRVHLAANTDIHELIAWTEIHDGRFEVIGLDPGRLRVTVEVDRCLPAMLVVEAGAQDVLFDVIQGGAIRGRVELPDGKPAPRAWVRIVDVGGDFDAVGGTRADDEGRFELRDVAPGDHRVVADWDDDSKARFRGEALAAGVKSGGMVEDVTVRMTRLP